MDRPVVVAPMGGGPTTPALVAAAGEAGALGFLAAAYKTAAEVAAQIDDVRRRSTAPFGVNVFVPRASTAQPAELDAYLRVLAAEADALGVDVGAATWDDDDWAAKVELLLDAAPPVASFTFGCPEPALVRRLQGRGVFVMVTITNVAEARTAADAGADGLCLQGIEAGAHRGSFADDDTPGLAAFDLLAAVRAAVDLPLAVAGGIALPEHVHAALAAGAAAVQCGTAFLRCDESAATALLKDALVDPAFGRTAFTRSFSGRTARGLVNRFMEAHPDAPVAYPEINNATRPLRAAAVHNGDPHGVNLWAGTGHRQARTGPAADIVAWLTSAAG